MNECTNKSKRKKKTMNIEKFEEFISQYPIFEYRILDTKDITIQERVRTICQEECERYDSTWACPPAVGTLQECEKKIKSYPQAVFFSSVAEVSDLMNMQEMLQETDFYQLEELKRRIKEVVDALPPIYREAFVMHRFKNKSYKEIAEFLQISPKTVDYRIQQALKQLRITLKDYLPQIMLLFPKNILS